MQKASCSQRHFLLTLVSVLAVAWVLRFLHLAQHGLDSFDAATFLCYTQQHRDILLHLWEQGHISPSDVVRLAEAKGYLYSPTSLGAIPWLDKPLHNLLLLVSGWLFNWGDKTVLYPAALFSFLSVALVYFLCSILAENRWLGLVSAFLAGISGFLIVQARLAFSHEEATLCVLAGLLMHLLYLNRGGYKFEIGAALFWGLAICAHPDTMPFVGIYCVLSLAGTFVTSRGAAFRQGACLSVAALPVLLLYDLPLWWGMLAWGKSEALGLFISKLTLKYQIGDLDKASEQMKDLYKSLPEGLYIFTSLSKGWIQNQDFAWIQRLKVFLFYTTRHEGYPMILVGVALWCAGIASPLILWFRERAWNARFVFSAAVSCTILFFVFYSGSTPEVRHVQHLYVMVIFLGLMAVFRTVHPYPSGRAFRNRPWRIPALVAGLTGLLIMNLLYLSPIYSYQNGVKQAVSWLQAHDISQVYTAGHSGVNAYLPAYGIKVRPLPEDARLEDLSGLEDGTWVVRNQWPRFLDQQVLRAADSLGTDKARQFRVTGGVEYDLLFHRRFGTGANAMLWDIVKNPLRWASGRPSRGIEKETLLKNEIDMNRWVVVRHRDVLAFLHRRDPEAGRKASHD